MIINKIKTITKDKIAGSIDFLKSIVKAFDVNTFIYCFGLISLLNIVIRLIEIICK